MAKKIYAKILGVSSITWGVLYFACIPVFAFIYHFFLPFQFYHSTVQYEKNFLNKDEKNILAKLKENLIYNYKLFHTHSDSTINGYYYSIESINCTDLEALNDKIQFQLCYDFKSMDSTHTEGHLCSTVFYTYNSLFSSYSPNGDKINWEYKRVYYDTLSQAPFDLSIFFPHNVNLIMGYGKIYPVTRIPSGLNNDIVGYKNAVKGLPSRVSGNLGRMLYFSAVTIATVGFGDIVPLTDEARLLVAIEAILGILFIGLFLNSIANKIRNETP